jgi:hypothetical protein
MTDRVRNQTSLHRFPVGETGLAFATNSLSAQPATRFVALFLVFALDFAAPHVIIPAVGSANVSLLAVLLLVGCLCLFQPHLLAGRHSWPLSLQP